MGRRGGGPRMHQPRLHSRVGLLRHSAGARAAKGGASLRRASGRAQGWRLRPKGLPQATCQRADRTESEGGRERPEPRPEATRVLERKCEVRERRVAANLGFFLTGLFPWHESDGPAARFSGASYTLQASTGRVAAGGSALLRQQGRARVPALGPTVGSRGEARAKLTRGPCS